MAPADSTHPPDPSNLEPASAQKAESSFPPAAGNTRALPRVRPAASRKQKNPNAPRTTHHASGPPAPAPARPGKPTAPPAPINPAAETRDSETPDRTPPEIRDAAAHRHRCPAARPTVPATAPAAARSVPAWPSAHGARLDAAGLDLWAGPRAGLSSDPPSHTPPKYRAAESRAAADPSFAFRRVYAGIRRPAPAPPGAIFLPANNSFRSTTKDRANRNHIPGRRARRGCVAERTNDSLHRGSQK